MEKAKQTVSSFLSNDGKHKTTVDEDVRPHVTEEHVRPHRHEEVTTALDKEVHQEHHHTTIQPITHKETLPEQHHHNLIPVEHKTFHHDNEQETRATLDREAAKFRDTSETHSTTHTSTTAPVITGERIHHHVHEHVQPVIQKETIQPHVVHTTIPIHETHHAAPVHHGTSVLPTKTLDEFTTERGGLAQKAAQKLTEFEGCPKPYRKELQREQLDADKSMHLHGHEGAGLGQTAEGSGLHSTREGHGVGRTTEGVLGGAAVGAAGAAATRKSRHGLGHKDRRGSSSSSSSSSDEESRGLGKSRKSRGLGAATAGGATAGAATGGLASHPKTTGTSTGIGGATTGMGAGTGFDRPVGSTTAGTGYNQTKTGALSNDPMNKTHARPDSGVDMHSPSSGSTTTTARKPSLIDRLNPLKDADGDGKKGFLD
ncbi:hypothetical protein CEP53_004375 [Fusarium sp. AF-6]|nr:hypothetical protein CEP53_004375 [Fusarium sp. AF-6]